MSERSERTVREPSKCASTEGEAPKGPRLREKHTFGDSLARETEHTIRNIVAEAEGRDITEAEGRDISPWPKAKLFLLLFLKSNIKKN